MLVTRGVQKVTFRGYYYRMAFRVKDMKGGRVSQCRSLMTLENIRAKEETK